MGNTKALFDEAVYILTVFFFTPTLKGGKISLKLIKITPFRVGKIILVNFLNMSWEV